MEGIISIFERASQYPNNSDCEWILDIEDESKAFQLTFEVLDIQFKEDCDADYVMVSHNYFIVQVEFNFL